jgi:hypothetical protein
MIEYCDFQSSILDPPSSTSLSRENQPALKRRRPMSGVAYRIERSGEAR